MIASPLSNYIQATEGIRKFYDYIDSCYPQKPNILLGFGLVSKDHGLSQFIPIDLYNMILAAEGLRRHNSPEIAREVHIIIADHLALGSEHGALARDQVEIMRKKYKKKIKNIIKNLGVEQHYTIHMGSDILVSEEYAQIRSELEQLSYAHVEVRSGLEELSIKYTKKLSDLKKLRLQYPQKGPENKQISHQLAQVQSKLTKINYQLAGSSQDTQNILTGNGYNKEQLNYFLDQVTMMHYLYQTYHCGVKISWTRNSDANKIKNSKSYDEAHFDRFYRELFQKDGMSFLYTEPGYAANVNGVMGVCPYSAPEIDGIQRVSLHNEALIPECEVNEKLIKSVSRNVSTILSCLLKDEPELNIEQISFQNKVNFLRQFARNPEKILTHLPSSQDELLCFDFNKLSLKKPKV